jgi:Tol biopolymer transport system component
MEFFEKYKKIFLVIGFIAITALIGFTIYSTFFRPAPTEPEPSEEPTTPEGGLPTAEEGEGQIVEEEEGEITFPEEVREPVSEVARGGLTKVTELSETSTSNPALSQNGSDLKYYDKETGQFYTIDKNGNIQLLTEKVFHNVDEVTWSPADNKAILEYPDGSNIMYNFETETQVTLPKHWKDFDFSPEGDKLVLKSIGISENNRWLAVSNDDGSKVTPIEDLGDKDETVYPSWSPNQQSIAMYTEGIDFDSQDVYFVGLNNENFKSTTIEGRGFDPLWSSNGDKLLYSVYSSENDYKPNLWFVNAQGDKIGTNRTNLNLETWASKCVFSDNNSVYCAVPTSLPEASGLFKELANRTKDNLVKINLSNGQKKLVAIPDGTYNMSNLIISDNGYYLYFTDSVTGRLNQIKLK